MKVVITGAAGFVWKNLVQAYAQAWHEVIACQRKKWWEQAGVRYAYFDYTLQIEQSDIFENIGVFIHSGSCTDYTWSREKLFLQNVESLKNILEISKNAQHFIYISSSSVYQGISWEISVQTQIQESNLENSYSYSKYKAEQYIQQHFHNQYISVIRPRAIYGAWDTTLIPQVLKSSIFWYLLLPGNGLNKTSLSDVWAFVEYIMKLSTYTTSWIYNFSTELRSYEEIYTQISQEYSQKGIIHIPLWVCKILKLYNKNKYSYILDTFWNDKILK